MPESVMNERNTFSLVCMSLRGLPPILFPNSESSLQQPVNGPIKTILSGDGRSQLAILISSYTYTFQYKTIRKYNREKRRAESYHLFKFLCFISWPVCLFLLTKDDFVDPALVPSPDYLFIIDCPSCRGYRSQQKS